MRKKIDINKEWQFHKGDISFDEIAGCEWEDVTLPHTWNNLDGQDGGNDYYQGRAWYRKILSKELIPEGFDKDVLIRFGAASKRAEIYLDGELIGSHEGGFAAFTIRLTDKLGEGDAELLVMADNSKDLPIYPMQADFTFFGGLYRGVSLMCFDCSDHFKADEYGADAIFITSSPEGKVTLRTALDSGESKALVNVRVYEGTGADKKLVTKINDLLMKKNAGGLLEGNISVENAKLWDGVASPCLYTLEMDLGDGVEGPFSDRISATFGFRSFRVDIDEGFFLNGRSYPLHGGNPGV